ncbi:MULTISPECIES: TonB-dependent receptor [Rhodomicrobium]|uniref:TonB-dependent receptor plug domain-containing protein n=1 Tax=Rhodomicrobium TaxID=1068 RepID=UPI000B4BF8C4|nr:MULTISPECIES: TonB-dependent receptor [Rhodomicrobium]
MSALRAYAYIFVFSTACAASSAPLKAQEPTALEGIVVTANRFPEEAGKIGSAVTVIGREEIEAARAENIVELLETVPGLTINQAGGLGGTASVSIRGADPDQTLVMIDGVRVNDPASTGSEFDFSVFTLANVERIEVIRGPQSGVYGSDAIGGVINIITRKGEGAPHAVTEIEGGSYKTFAQRAYAAGSKDGVSVSVGATNFRTSGFSRFDGGSEDDAARKQSINARLDYDPTDVFGVTVTAARYEVKADTDSIGLTGTPRDAADNVDRVLTMATASAHLSLLGGGLQNRLTAFVTDSDRDFFDDNGARTTPSLIGKTSTFEGTSRGVEYQGELAPRGVDRLVFGGKLDQQTGLAFDEDTLKGFKLRYDVEEVWRSAFAIYSFNPTDELNLTGAVRADEFGPAGTEATYRLTAAYRVPAWGTKFRGSYGTGAKAPTFQQRFEDSAFAKGNPDLTVETSRGFDAGVDQELADGAVTLSGSYFSNDIEDLIAFDGKTGSFKNIAAAEIDGVELSAVLRPARWMSLRGAYTYLDAIDAATGLALQRRPNNAFNVKLTVLPVEGVSLSASATYVGERFNNDGEEDLLDSYVRVDLAGSYALSPGAELYLRAENLLDADYEEIKNFATAGRSAYLGLRARF